MTGKTESAMRVGREAVKKHGMSFFYVKDATVFDELLNQSKKYQPCIIFLEDVEEITAGEQRDADMNKILNTLDGVQTKGNNLTVIFTTNHPERINSALRRPGRIDLVICFERPDDVTKAKIYKSYFEGQKTAGEAIDYDRIVSMTPPVQGAVIAEICKRSVKLGQQREGLTTDIVISCIASMEFHVKLMNEEVDKEAPEVKLVKDMALHIGGGSAFEDLTRKINTLAHRMGIA